MNQPTHSIFSPTRPTIVATSIEDLDTAYVAAPRNSLAVSGRYGQVDGVQVCLGGLDWTLSTPQAVVTFTTDEYEALPDLPVVRAAWPMARPSVTSIGSGVAA